MPATQTFTATDFKANCLEIFDRLAARKLIRVTVTKRGRVVAVLTPPEDAEALAQTLFGFMEGSVVAPADFDYTAPVLDEPLEAERGAPER
ncbi:MAG TPA: type II toxin-antitoxin system prevent-host-death family antitoxin [Caulobacteraceae bacterium]|jgi:prevent-host-death family protein